MVYNGYLIGLIPMLICLTISKLTYQNLNSQEFQPDFELIA